MGDERALSIPPINIANDLLEPNIMYTSSKQFFRYLLEPTIECALSELMGWASQKHQVKQQSSELSVYVFLYTQARFHKQPNIK